MGTRSAIGVVEPNGTIRAVYCHWDGYPEHHLPILQEHYNTAAKARKLIAPGSMSSLRTTHTWESAPVPDPDGGSYSLMKGDKGLLSFMKDEKGLTIYSHLRDPQPLYHHERGDGTPPATFTQQFQAEAHFRGMDCEHMYLYRPKYGWFHYPLELG